MLARTHFFAKIFVRFSCFDIFLSPEPSPTQRYFCLVPSVDRVLRSGCNRHEWEISFFGEGFLDFKLVKEFFLTPLGQNKVKKVILHMLCARKVRFDSWSVQKNIFCRGILGCLR